MKSKPFHIPCLHFPIFQKQARLLISYVSSKHTLMYAEYLYLSLLLWTNREYITHCSEFCFPHISTYLRKCSKLVFIEIPSHYFYCCYLVTKLCPTLLQPHRLKPARLFCPWDFPGRNTEAGCHFLLQGIFPTKRLNPCLLHW